MVIAQLVSGMTPHRICQGTAAAKTSRQRTKVRVTTPALDTPAGERSRIGVMADLSASEARVSMFIGPPP
ncbi:hypothetical protein FJ420_25415 [Mesorhizobium sp. B3-1-3]|uniref:hypothetical protein n=1 Tax=unclassified Mesorhizobium TaxID=325217 RepID=UPI00112BD73D|nr:MULTISPECIES: hypothetical protein [unclassified Mesorhizobium]TPI66140.1 hypothetical protein FJ420_25415 [Mesorhizobium sp. B3-1-3]TPI67004.1 hypothetical protein FJ424_11995 [Mesorhizobium sp. B3-1-8]